MSNHLEKPLQDLLANSEKIVFPSKDFNINLQRKFTGRLRYYCSLSVLGFFLLFAMPPIRMKDLESEKDSAELLIKARKAIAE